MKQAPAFRGDEGVSLACGSCRIVLGREISEATLAGRLIAPKALFICCPKCGAYNRINVQVMH